MKLSSCNSRPIKVMYLIDTYLSPPGSPMKGGAEKQLYLLASSLDPAIFRPVVVQLIPDGTLPMAAGSVGNVKLFHLPTRKFYSPGGMRQIGRLVSLAKREQVDIIQTFFEKSEVMGWLVKRLAGVPVWIASRRDLGFKRKKIYDRVFAHAARDCSGCVANCNAIKTQMVRHEGVAPGKIGVIYNGLELPSRHETTDGAALKKELGITASAPLVGMVANLNFEIKGHRYFLEAAKRISEKFSDVEFLLVGEGLLRNGLEQMARDLGLEKKVHFLGKRSDVPAILAALSVSVLSSTSEGLSNVILESMAAGKPVVATLVGGSPELVVDGVTGHLVPPADASALAGAICSLLKDRDKAAVMGAAARKIAEEKFSVRAMVEGYERLYKSLI